jgi:hypothetical protein
MFEWIFEILVHGKPNGRVAVNAETEKKARTQTKIYLRTGEKAGKLVSKKEIGD